MIFSRALKIFHTPLFASKAAQPAPSPPLPPAPADPRGVVWDLVLPTLDHFASINTLARTSRSLRAKVMETSWKPLLLAWHDTLQPFAPTRKLKFLQELKAGRQLAYGAAFKELNALWGPMSTARRNLQEGRAWVSSLPSRIGSCPQQHAPYSPSWTQSALSPDGKELVVVRRDFTAALHTVDHGVTGSATKSVNLQSLLRGGRVGETLLAPVGDHIAVHAHYPYGGEFGLRRVSIVALKTGQVQHVDAIPDMLYTMRWSSDGRHLAIANSPGPVVLATVGKPNTVTVDGSACTSHIAFSPNNKRVAIATRRPQILLCDVATGEPQLELPALRVENLVWSPDGARIACVIYNRVLVFDTDTGEQVADVAHDAVQHAAWSADSKRLATGTGSGYINPETLKVTDFSNAEPLVVSGDVPDRNSRASQIAWSPCGNAVAVAFWGGSVHIINPADGEVLFKTHFGVDAAQITWAEDGTALVCSHGDGTVQHLRFVP